MNALFPHDGWPVYFEPITDFVACARPSALTEPLADVSRAWPGTPACLQELMAKVIDEAVDKATAHACQCEQYAPTQAAVRDLQRFYGALQPPRTKSVNLAANARFVCQSEASE